MAYQLKHFGVAAELYAQEYDEATDESSKAYKASMASKSYAQINDMHSAYEWVVKRMQIDQSIDDLDNLAALALTQGDYELAERAYNNLYKTTNDRNFLSQVGYIKKLSYDEDEFKVEVPRYNSEGSDYSPALFESSYISFTSDRESVLSVDGDTFTGRGTSDIYLIGKKNQSPFLFDQPINTAASEGNAAFNALFDEVYFTRCVSIEERDVHCRIYKSIRRLGSWSDPEPIIFFDETVNVGQPAYIDSDSLLVFSAKDTENYQLYFSRKMDNGWTLPELLPESISGPYNEKFPVFDQDTLYFSSDRFPGYGALDLYRVHIDQSGFWTEPEILDAPYNSGADDFGYCVIDRFSQNDRRIKTVLVSSNRIGTTGLDDIFEITQYHPKEDTISKPPSTDEEHSIYIALSVKDQASKAPLRSTLVLNGAGLGETIETDASGKHIQAINSTGQILTIAADSDGYYHKDSTVEIVDRSTLSRDTTINVSILLDKIEVGKEIVLENIYYDYNKWDIRSDAEPSLNDLVVLLQANPKISIELASHTDCRGEVDYNQDLSSKRAASARDYIVNNGINRNRINYRGYGELNPIAKCNCDDCTDDQHQENRRTSFKVVSIN